MEFFTPHVHFPVYTIERLWFNELLRGRDFSGFDAVIGFDLDGYSVRANSHVACIKGVIADEMRFERGLTRLTMAIQARYERKHVRRANLVLTTSRYAAQRIRLLYNLPRTPEIVPELIDLAAWRELFARNPARRVSAGVVVLTVCRFYPRKRLDVLLRAATRLPDVAFRIVGGGPEEARLVRMRAQLRLHNVVFLRDLDQDELAREYNGCDVFCLPSVQEGFGIVFLEAMAAAKPVVAARAAAAPEVVTDGILVEPNDPAALADAIGRLASDAALRCGLGEAGNRRVEEFDAPRVARRFLEVISA